MCPTQKRTMKLISLSLSLSLSLCAASSSLFFGSSEAGTFHHPPATHRHLIENTLQQSLTVELRSNPSLLGGDLKVIEAERAAFLESLTIAGIEYTLRASYEAVMNGVSIVVHDESKISGIEKFPAVQNVFYNYLVDNPITHSIGLPEDTTDDGAEPQLRFAHNMTGVTAVQTGLNITGKGIKVGIIDTGIDYTHPAFGACGKIGGTCRVASGYDFVGNDFNPSDRKNNVPKPSEDPMDCNGHGTHVAGIVGGRDDKVTGVAPDVTFGAYRVFSCSGSTATDIIVSAMERSFKDGMDVINLSLGGGSAWPGYPTAKVADRLSKQGLIVLGAMGNDGDQGLWNGASPGLSAEGLGIASFDNAFYLGRVLQASPDNKEMQFSVEEGLASLLKDGEVVVSNADLSAVNDGCDPYLAGRFAGKIALIRRGTCTFLVKAQNAQAAGASAVIIFNRADGALAIALKDPSLKIPVAGMSKADGEEIFARSQAAPVTLHWLPGTKAFPNPTGGKVSSFSSWGLSPDLAIKPDLGGPGGLILSAWPMSLGQYKIISGTSMATPYVAGVAALYISENNDIKGKVDPDELKIILQNNAVPATLLDVNAAVSVAQQGAGLVNAFHTLRGNTRVTPSNLRLGEISSSQQQATITKTITIINMGEEMMKYKLTHMPSGSVNAMDSYIPRYEIRSSSVVFSEQSFTLKANKSKSIKVSISPNTTLSAPFEKWIISGYIKVEPQSSYQPNPDYNPVYVPYAGFRGDYKSYDVFPVTGGESPELMSLLTYATKQGPIYKSPNETATFTFKSAADMPIFRTRVLHPSPLIATQLYNATNDELLGYISYDPLVGMTDPLPSQPAYYKVLQWRSLVGKPVVIKDPVKLPSNYTQVPDGTYYAVISAEKALGDPNRTSDNQTWRSPKIVVKMAA